MRSANGRYDPSEAQGATERPEEGEKTALTLREQFRSAVKEGLRCAHADTTQHAQQHVVDGLARTS